MNRAHLLRILSIGLALLLLLPAPPAAAAPAQVEPTFTAWALTPPPPTLCPGDRAAISIFIQNTLLNLPAAGYPVNITQQNPPAGSLMPVSKVVTNGTVSFTYTAVDNGSIKGTVTDLLTFKVGGYPTGLSIPITINQCSDYEIDFLVEKSDENEVVRLYSYFSGEGIARRVAGQLTGEGTSEVFMSIFGSNQNYVCMLAPPIQGTGTMQEDGVISPQGVGVDRLNLLLSFDPIRVNSAELTCVVINAKASYPFEVPPWDPNDDGIGEVSLTLTNNQGTTAITMAGMTGQLTVRREVIQ